jgi:hypothetical protein
MNFMPGNMEKKNEIDARFVQQHGKFRPTREEEAIG